MEKEGAIDEEEEFEEVAPLHKPATKLAVKSSLDRKNLTRRETVVLTPTILGSLNFSRKGDPKFALKKNPSSGDNILDFQM